MPKNQMLAYAKYLSTVAKARRTRSLKAILSNEEPLPQAYKNWGIRDVRAPMKEKVTYANKQGEQFTFSSKNAQSYVLVDFDVSDKMKRNEIYSRLKYIRAFLKTKTSTLGGWREYQREFVGKMEDILKEKIGKRVNIFGSQDKINAFWRVYSRVEEQNPNIVNYSSTQVQAMIYQMFEDNLPIDEYNQLDIEEITDMAQQRLDELEREKAKKDIQNEKLTNPLSIGRNRYDTRNK